MEKTDSKNPIFILGIMQRSGTNFLHDLLCLHPDCSSSGPVLEDNFIRYAPWLVKYASRVYQSWEGIKNMTPELKAQLLESLGKGLAGFLGSFVPSVKRVVAKTPSVENLDLFFKVFPDAALLIVVRDGRSVVESGVKGFKWSYEEATRGWASAARTILEFDEKYKNSGKSYRIVKYEDLLSETRKELTSILEFLALNPRTYDYDAAEKLPVRGSSLFRGEKKEVHWDPLEKTPAFNSLSRWDHWTSQRHERFNWIAGKYLTSLGYAEKQTGIPRAFSGVRNVGCDLGWNLRTVLRILLRKLKQAHLKSDCNE